MKRIILLISILFLIISCNNKFIQGEWSSLSGSYLIFSNEQDYKLEGSNDFVLEGKYELDSKNSSLILHNQNDFTVNLQYEILDNKLIIWNYKSDSGKLKDHIDEINTFEKNDKIKNSTNKIEFKDKFLLPSDFIGDVYVNYGQDGVGNNEIEKTKNRIIRVDLNGLAKTQFQESVVTFGLCNYEFHSGDKELYFFNEDILHHKDHKLDLNIDSVYACIYGFNQAGRRQINTIYNEDITGNVLMFRIDTLSNIIERIEKYLK